MRWDLPEEAASIPDFTVSSDKKPEPLVKEVTGKEYLESIQRRNASVQQTRINLPVNEVKPQNHTQTQIKKEVAAENRNSVKGKSMPKTAAPAVKKAVVQRPARTAAPAKKSAKSNSTL